MDIYMPNKNGIDATKEILLLDAKAKVLVCSASGDHYDTQAALDIGASATILKPFAAKEVYDCIKKVLTGK
jgi:two-component system chemotaxis response regulator CheY